jgi:hypothetical protein
MPIITADEENLWGRVVITAAWADEPTVTHARVLRLEADGTETVIRSAVSTDTSGEYMLLSGGLGIWYDTEAPMGSSLFYRTEGLGSTSTATSTEIITSDEDFWLKSPLYPAFDRMLLLSETSDPACVPASSIYFQSMAEEAYSTRNTRFVINNRRAPTIAVRVRGTVESTLVLVTRTFNDRDAVLDLVEPGAALLLQAPPQYGIPDRYMDVGDTSVTRLSADHRKPWRLVELPHVEVLAPAGLSYGVLGTRWEDICGGIYPTFDDAEFGDLTWEQIMYGYASIDPSVPPPGWRTYIDVDSEFATYAILTATGKTYEELLEGD